jgi:hypothetical protein
MRNGKCVIKNYRCSNYMAHLLSWMIAEDLSLDDILDKPFLPSHPGRRPENSL